MSIRRNAQALRFHEIHGKNIELKCNRTKAIRKSNDSLNNIVFSQLPVMILQPLVFKITQTETYNFFSFKIGFTINDPYNIPNVTDHSEHFIDATPGNKTRLLLRSMESRQVLISFYVKQSGSAYYTINDGDEGILVGGIDISKQLWAFIYLTDFVSEIEWVGMASCLESPLKKVESPKTYFHWIHGRDISFTNNRTTACRSQDPGYYAYVFTNRPFEFNENVVFSVNKCCNNAEEILEYGITSNDPSKIYPDDLPANAGDLLNFLNYWVFVKDKHKYNVGDVINFNITSDGKFTVLKNFSSQTCLLQIDITQPLWLFIKLCGSVSVISTSWSTEEYCDMTEENQFIASSGSGLYSYGSTAIDNSIKITKCIFCCEKAIDCVVYRCGHICMCYECAESAWQCKDIVNCPVCRALIQDIIKIYS